MAGTIAQLSGAAESEDYIAAHSAFVKGRTDIAPEERAIKGKVLDAGYALSGAIDRVTVNFMARALFNHEYNTNGGDGLITYPEMLENESASKEYQTAYNMIMKSYLGGAYGEVGTRAAAKKLETALRNARSKADDKYSSEEETNEGGDLDGQK